MEDKAQVAFEHLIIIALLMTLASVIVMLVSNFFATQGTRSDTILQYGRSVREMFGP